MPLPAAAALLVALAASAAAAKGPDADLDVVWLAPFLSGGGFSSEAISFALPLGRLLPGFRIRQFAEQPSAEFVQGLSKGQARALSDLLHRTPRHSAREVAVCHSTPDLWVPSRFPGWDEAEPCPPPTARYTIGRTMYETDSVPRDWVARLNRLDEVWVPTPFHRATFLQAGVTTRVDVVPEAVDGSFFEPSRARALPAGALGDLVTGPALPASARPVRLLSVFKWEPRKAPELLLEAYGQEFTDSDSVELVIKTEPFHTEANLTALVQAHVARGSTARGAGGLPRVRLLTDHLPLASLPALYAACDAFVLPSRGEGWGRPHAEAMAMGLPVVATNWSGPTAFVDESNGYPVRVEALEAVPKDHAVASEGHRWALPDAAHLRARMRSVVDGLEEARRRGAKARRDMLERFSPEAVAEVALKRLRAAHEALGAAPPKGAPRRARRKDELRRRHLRARR